MQIRFEKGLEQGAGNDSREMLRKKAAGLLGVNASELADICILKHSIDAKRIDMKKLWLFTRVNQIGRAHV